MQPLVWVACLLVVGLVALALEVFLPSGGVLGFLSVVAVSSAVGMAFVEIGPGAGLGTLVVASVAVPVVLSAAFRWFPETPLGRRVLPAPPSPADVVPAAERRDRLRSLAGRRGLTLSELLPWGAVDVAGERHEAVSEGGPIAAGAAVEVCGLDGVALVVRPVPATPAVPSAAPRSSGPASPPPAVTGASGLSATLEAFDFDDLQPPPA